MRMRRSPLKNRFAFVRAPISMAKEEENTPSSIHPSMYGRHRNKLMKKFKVIRNPFLLIRSPLPWQDGVGVEELNSRTPCRNNNNPWNPSGYPFLLFP